MISIQFAIVLTIVILVLGTGVYVMAIRPWHLRWGTTDDENTGPLPGDSVKPDAGIQVTHAITINAPPRIVWQWLLQLGQGRGGFYSYDWLESFFGLRIHNVEELRPELQDLRVGDFIQAAPEGWLGGRFKEKAGWVVVTNNTESSLILRDLLEHGTWAFILRSQGSNKTRLIIRARGNKPKGLMKLLHYGLFEPAHFLMERKMMITLKRLAENPAISGALGNGNSLNVSRGLY